VNTLPKESFAPRSPHAIEWLTETAGLNETLRDQLTQCWADVSNAGGAVGFPITPVSLVDVRPAVDDLAADVASGGCAVVHPRRQRQGIAGLTQEVYVTR
jgi:hypothetical protein